jgi:hypothetical protein
MPLFSLLSQHPSLLSHGIKDIIMSKKKKILLRKNYTKCFREGGVIYHRNTDFNFCFNLLARYKLSGKLNGFMG